MPDPIIDTPESPPVGPVIPKGWATRGAELIVPLLAIIAGISAVLEGDHSEVTLTTIGGAIATFITVAFGRQMQAAAAYRDAPSPRQMDDFSGELDLVEAFEVPEMPEGEYDEAAEVEKLAELRPEGAIEGKPGLGS